MSIAFLCDCDLSIAPPEQILKAKVGFTPGCPLLICTVASYGCPPLWLVSLATMVDTHKIGKHLLAWIAFAGKPVLEMQPVFLLALDDCIL